MKRLTVDEFIRKAKEVHLDKYDYSSIKYVYALKEGVEITCPIHGRFLQKPISHINGQGCPSCGGTSKSDTVSFISKAKLKHKSKFSYEKVNYSNNRTKVIITCPIHGDFMQTPDSHLRGNGCPDCGKINTSKKLVMTHAEFLERAKTKHDGKYRYDKVVYKNSKSPVIITCNLHGDFDQSPNMHLQGFGCSECGGTKKLNTNSFISKASRVHQGKYNYSKVQYVNNSTKVTITCNEHGDFIQTPMKHLQGQGCRICSGKNNHSLDSFIAKAKIIHADKFKYEKSTFINVKTKIIITCPVHGDFEQIPSEHLSGYGCKKCGNNTKYSTEEFVSKARKIHGDKYGYQDVAYKSSTGKIIIECPFHGLFEQRPTNHLKGQGCPKCNLPKGEQRIINLLENLKLSYITQFTFEDCIHIKPLPFDFLVIKDSEKYLIEFQGEQHYQSINYGKNKTDFDYRKKIDAIKKEYAMSNNIPFIEIPYTEIDRVEKIINKFLGIEI
jgi:hypothetical protein